MQSEFPVLRAIAYVQRVVGILLLVGGLILIARTASESWDIKESWVESVGTFALGFGTFAVGELTLLLLQIEKNTRKE